MSNQFNRVVVSAVCGFAMSFSTGVLALGCGLDTQCHKNQHCVRGVCSDDQCQTANDCNTGNNVGLTCTNGQCVPL